MTIIQFLFRFKNKILEIKRFEKEWLSIVSHLKLKIYWDKSILIQIFNLVFKFTYRTFLTISLTRSGSL